jgi:iron complex outermembrane receptor protein
VNVVTNDPTDKYEGKIFVEGGSYNTVDSNATINLPLTDDMAIRVTTVAHQSTGFMHPDERNGTDFELLRGKLLYQPSEDLKILLTGDFMNAEIMGNADALPQITGIANFASPAFGGFNPCGGNPVLNKYDPWHSPAKYYAAFGCTVPAQQPVNPSPVTGVCQAVSRQEETVADIGTQTSWDFGWANWTLIANYDGARAPMGNTADGPYEGTTPGQNLFTNSNEEIVETRLNSPSDSPLKWVGGLYYDSMHNWSYNWNHVSVTGANAPIGGERYQRNRSLDKSAFGQTTVPITDGFRVIAGVRYASDLTYQNTYNVNVGSGAVIGNPSHVNIPTNKLTYKGGVEVDLAPNSLLYANTSTGYRPTMPNQNVYCVGKVSKHAYLPADGSGVVNAYPQGGCSTAGAGAAAVGGDAGEGTALTTVNVSTPPDSMTAYEVGSKNRFLDNKLEVNIDGFYYHFQSLTISATGANDANQTTVIAHAQTGTKAWGSELEVTALVTSNDRVDVSLTWEPTETGISPYALPECFNFGTPTHPAISVLGSSTNLALCSAKNLAANASTVNWVRYAPGVSTNTPLFYAPLWSGNIGYSHVFDLASGATVTASLTEHFQSSENVSAAQFYDGVQRSYHMTNLSVGYDTADGKWRLTAWVKNLENTAVNLGSESGATVSATDYVYYTMAPPRMWGVNLTAKF